MAAKVCFSINKKIIYNINAALALGWVCHWETKDKYSVVLTCMVSFGSLWEKGWGVNWQYFEIFKKRMINKSHAWELSHAREKRRG